MISSHSTLNNINYNRVVNSLDRNMFFIVLILSVIVFIALTFKAYQKLTCGLCHSNAHMVGKVVIVTGGNSGIGLETAKNLAERGARVIITCRNVRRAAEAKDEIIKATGNTEVVYRYLDFASLRSVHEFSEEIYKTEGRLDVLINNAGAGGLGNYKTEDGNHIGMQVNYFGSFLLTCLLLPLLKKSAPSRIVNVSSLAHKYADDEMNYDNLNMEKHWSDYSVYANSKLYINLMKLELVRRLRDTGVTVNSLHPGVCATNIFRNIKYKNIRKFIKLCVNFLFQTPWEAAQTSIYLAVSLDVKDVSGSYFCDCRMTKPSRLSQDADVAKRLWLKSEKLVKFS